MLWYRGNKGMTSRQGMAGGDKGGADHLAPSISKPRHNIYRIVAARNIDGKGG